MTTYAPLIRKNGKIIELASTDTISGAPAGSDGSAPLTTKGDLLTFSTVVTTLGVGSDGQVLTADSTAAKGIKWAASASSFTGGTLTSTLTLRTGGTAAGSEPLKFVSASLLTAATVGTLEFLTDKYYGTITTGTARKEFALWDAAGTSGRVPYETTNGRLTDVSTFTFDGTKLTVAGLKDSALSSGRIPYATTSGELTDTGNLLWDNTNQTLSIGTVATATKRIYTSGSNNGEQAIVCEQLNAGGSAYAGVFAQNGSASGGISFTGTGFTPSGVLAVSSIQFFHATSGKTLNISTNAGVINFSVDNFVTACAKFDTSGNLNITNAKNIILDTSTGTKIGTGTTQKLGFWNATPVAQKTGYGTPTGNVNQGSFAAGSITLANLAAHVAQLCLDLKATGMIGA